MMKVQKKTLKTAFDLLDALGCSYAVLDAEGNKYGTLDINQPKNRKRSPSEFPHGEKRNYVNSYLCNMKVGDVVVMPWGKYGKGLQGSVLSWFCKTHGVGSGTSTLNVEKQSIEVLRLK